MTNQINDRFLVYGPFYINLSKVTRGFSHIVTLVLSNL